MGEEIRSMASQLSGVPSSHSVYLQDANERYQHSKKELDELVASMEGL